MTITQTAFAEKPSFKFHKIRSIFLFIDDGLWGQDFSFKVFLFGGPR